MKVKSVGLLAALGMSLTSLTVWSLSAPRPEAPSVAVPDPVIAAPSARPALAAGDQFVVGKRLMVEGRLGHRQVVAESPGENFLFLDVTAEKDAGARNTSANVAIVIDRSGSMKGKRLQSALAAARGMVDRLRDGDVVTVVSYNTDASVLVSETINPSSRVSVRRAIDGISASGDTCISCGIKTAMDTLARRTGMVNRMLLLSDGEATTGVRDLEGFRRIGEMARRVDVPISSIGVDVDYNERVLSALAQESNGRHHFVEESANLTSVFDSEFQALSRTVADGAELELRLGPEVEVVKVFDRAFRREGDRLIVPLGSFSAGDQKTLLVKVATPAAAPGEQLVASVRLDYRDLVEGKAAQCEGELRALTALGPNALSSLDPLVSGRIERSETAQTLLEFNDLWKEGRVEEAKQRLSRSIARKKEARQAFATAPMAPKTKSKAAADFEAQEDALSRAESAVLAEPSPASGAASRPRPAPPTSRQDKAAVRKNQEEVFRSTL